LAPHRIGGTPVLSPSSKPCTNVPGWCAPALPRPHIGAGVRCRASDSRRFDAGQARPGIGEGSCPASRTPPASRVNLHLTAVGARARHRPGGARRRQLAAARRSDACGASRQRLVLRAGPVRAPGRLGRRGGGLRSGTIRSSTSIPTARPYRAGVCSAARRPPRPRPGSAGPVDGPSTARSGRPGRPHSLDLPSTLTSLITSSASDMAHLRG
jgi:hypothetical protein